MADKRTYSTRQDAPEIESLESILDTLDKEITAANANFAQTDPSNEMDLLVSDLLEHLEIEN